jgi:NAD-dependent dihydropyrimidine dehydrogenase PreA subunit
MVMPVKGWIEVDEITPKGYHPVKLVMEGCTGCGICAIMCPEAALAVYREAPVKTAKVTVTTT